MKSIPIAITWEMLQRGRWGLISGLLYALLLPTILFASLLQVEGFDLNDPSLKMMHLAFLHLQIGIFSFAATIIGVQEPRSRLYTYPISASALVSCQMFPAMVLAGLETLFTTTVINSIFKTEWPLWGPALFAGAFFTALQATVWYTEKSAWMPLAMALVFGGLEYWFHTRFSATNPMWRQTTPIEVLTMANVVITSYFVGVAGVSRNRSSEQIPPLGIVNWLTRMLNLQTLRVPKFRNPVEAQFWFEWQMKGAIFPAGVLVGLVVPVFFWTIASRDLKELIQGFVVGGTLLSLLGFVFGLISGNPGNIEFHEKMGQFLGSRPLTNSDMARVLLIVIGKSVLVAWGIWATAFLIACASMLLFGKTPEFPAEVHWWYWPATLLGCWIVASTFASIVMTGRAKLFTLISIGVMVVYFVLMVASAFAPSKELYNRVSDGLAACWGVGFVLGTAWIYVVARRKQLVGMPTVMASLGIWATLSTIIVIEMSRHPVGVFPGLIVLVGLAAMTVFPLAAAPLAISWNRTR